MPVNKIKEPVHIASGEIIVLTLDFKKHINSGGAIAGTPTFSITPSGIAVSNVTASGTKAQALLNTTGTSLGQYVAVVTVADDGSPQQTFKGCVKLILEPCG